MSSLVRIATAFCLAVIVATLAPAEAGVEGDMEVGIDRMYGDFANFDLPSGDPAECRQACGNDGRCVAWTFVKPGVQGPSARCWLKNQVPQPAVSHCCISGLRTGSVGGGGPITILEATYGANCGAQRGNVTGHIAQQCNGQASCDYRIDYTVIGDPVYGCAKDYTASYSCGGSTKQTAAGPEAGFGSLLQLRCP